MRRPITLIVTGIAIFLIAGFLLPGVIVFGFLAQEREPIQFAVPGEVQVTVDEPGRYYLWNDHETIFEGRTYRQSASLPGGYRISVRTEDGQKLNFVGDASLSETRGQYARNSIGYVEVDRPTTLDIQVTNGPDSRVFSFGQTTLFTMLVWICAGTAAALVGALTGIGICVWGIVMLVRSVRTSGTGAVSDVGQPHDAT